MSIDGELTRVMFRGWSRTDIIRQFWYLTQKIGFYDNSGVQELHDERNMVIKEAIRRGIATRGPFPKDGAEDLI